MGRQGSASHLAGSSCIEAVQAFTANPMALASPHRPPEGGGGGGASVLLTACPA